MASGRRNDGAKRSFWGRLLGRWRREADLSADAIPEQVGCFGNQDVPRALRLSEAVKRKMKKAGAAMGAKDKPASGAQAPCQTEDEVSGEFSQRAACLRQQAMDLINHLADLFGATPLVAPEKAPNGVLSDVTTGLASARQAAHQRLLSLRRRERTRYTQLQFFMSEAGLVRDATYPDSKLEHFAVILLIVVVECLMNAYFFSQAHSLGLLGGALQMALISVANVGVGVLIGALGIRQLGDRKLSRRIVGFVSAGAFVVFLIGFNLAVAHYRDVLAVAPDVAISMTVTALMNQPFSLSFESSVLFVLGAVAGILAVYKGLRADDLYPGFGRIDRHYREGLDAYERAVADSQREIREAIAAGHVRCQEMLDEAACAVENRFAMIRGIRAVIRRYDVAREALQSCCDSGLKTFRGANESVRVSPVPSYFREYPPISSAIEFDRFDEFEASATRERESLERLRAEVRGVKEQLAELTKSECESLDKQIEAIAYRVEAEMGNAGHVAPVEVE